MELLILSKLKWDLTAITAYDFLDHILERLQQGQDGADEAAGEGGDSSPLLGSNRSHLDSLRRHTEHLVSLCATDSSFLLAPTPPSVVASAALASALQQDFDSQPPDGEACLGDIFARIRKLARIEMVRRRTRQALAQAHTMLL